MDPKRQGLEWDPSRIEGVLNLSRLNSTSIYGGPCVPSTRVRFIRDNPKVAGSAARKRFQRYKNAKTIAEFHALGGRGERGLRAERAERRNEESRGIKSTIEMNEISSGFLFHGSVEQADCGSQMAGLRGDLQYDIKQGYVTLG